MLHQLSSELTRTKSVIVLEDSHVRGMQRNRHLALSISDAGIGELRRQLAYKSEWYGSRLVIADRWFPSSKLWSGCGTIKDTLGLNERVYDSEVTPVERKALATASADAKPAPVKQEAKANGTRRSTRRSTPKVVLVRV